MDSDIDFPFEGWCNPTGEGAYYKVDHDVYLEYVDYVMKATKLKTQPTASTDKDVSAAGKKISKYPVDPSNPSAEFVVKLKTCVTKSVRSVLY